MNESIWQSQTFKSLVLYVCVLVANAVARKWGVSLDASELAGFTVALVAFIAGRQFKQAKMLEQEIHPLQVAATENAKPADAPIASTPSVFKTLVPLMLVASMLTMPGCAWWQSQPKLRADLSACATGVVVGEVELLMGEAAKVMQQQPATWDASLEKMVLRAGQAGLCAIMALADALTSGTGGSETDPLGDYDRATQAAYLRAFARSAAR